MENRGDCFGRMEEVIERFNNMCTVVGDIISSVAWVAVSDMVVQIVVVKKLVTMLDLGQPRVVLGEGLKDIHGQLYWDDLYGSIATRLLMDEVHEHKNALLEFMDLNDTNYKFMDLKMYFYSLRT